jgi:hypothetical protein
MNVENKGIYAAAVMTARRNGEATLPCQIRGRALYFPSLLERIFFILLEFECKS